MPRQADLLPDWFVGGAGKRRLLRALTDEHSPLWESGPPWSENELAAQAELTRKNAVGRHLRVLESAGVLRAVGRGWEPTQSPLLGPLGRYLDALDSLPADPLPPSRGAAPRNR